MWPVHAELSELPLEFSLHINLDRLCCKVSCYRAICVEPTVYMSSVVTGDSRPEVELLSRDLRWYPALESPITTLLICQVQCMFQTGNYILYAYIIMIT